MGRYSGKTCRLIFMLVITFVFFVAEIVVGYLGNSIALVSDSFNMLSDLLSLCVGLSAARLSRRPGTARCTYGFGRAEVVGALANAVFLTALCFSISVEAITRLARPERIDDPQLVLIVGALGLAVNVVGLLIFQDCGESKRKARKRKGGSGEAPQGAGAPVLSGTTEPEGTDTEDGQPLNIRGVLLHVLGDALGSVVVVVASALFYALPLPPEQPCNWQCYVDPSLTLAMVIIVLSSATPLLMETVSILLQATPPSLALPSLMDDLLAVPGVSGIHELHVWELCRGRTVATLHLHCLDRSAFSVASPRLREIFHRAGVHSVTIQPEFEEEDKGETGGGQHCRAPCVSPKCQSLSCCKSDPNPALVSVSCNGNLSPAPSPPASEDDESVALRMLGEGAAERDMQSSDGGVELVNSTKF
ncbi:calcium/manganese antiporter SLC30A10 [Amia ocellicauda]|uniref:calcium/manganese antiporter SLC30A10 n=1 Tax=Amia ocellicauda TaxID=2972642 RepID=UPI00346460AA